MLIMNCTGNLVMAFSGSSATNHIGAYYAWRPGNGTALDMPRLIRAGITNYLSLPAVRLGDYSATTLDPADDWSFWTIQEYADPSGGDFFGLNPWKTVVTKIRANP